tara:strand:+ start:375 stop:662 length:288 start_codon:yes stop_codon:yes gene_type:complete
MSSKLLTSEALKALKNQIPNWTIKESEMTIELNFKDFIEAFGFLAKLALICESIEHHAEIHNIYSKVIINLTTHDLGGLSNKDELLARKINDLII